MRRDDWHDRRVMSAQSEWNMVRPKTVMWRRCEAGQASRWLAPSRQAGIAGHPPRSNMSGGAEISGAYIRIFSNADRIFRAKS